MRMKNILYIAIVLASALMAGCGPERSSIDENGFAVVRILAPAAEDSSAAKAASDIFEENVKLLKNNIIMQAVASRMTDRARDALSAAASRENMSVEDILLENLVVRWSGRDGAMLIGFKFPDKKMSADLANVCAAEFVSNSQSAAVKSIMDSIDELREKVAQQEEKVRAIDEKLLALRVEHGSDFSDDAADRCRADLRNSNAALASAKATLEKAKAAGDGPAVESAQKVFNAAEESVAKNQKEALGQGKASAEYKALERERRTAEAMHASLIDAMNKRVYEVNTAEAPAVIVRRASM